jgi:ABC-2 type transport system permease protein
MILQQTLLIGAAMLTGTALAKGGGALAGVFGRGIAHLTIYLPALALYLIVLPRIYGFSTLGHLPEIFALATVFLLATSFMGQAIGASCASISSVPVSGRLRMIGSHFGVWPWSILRSP